MFAGSDNLHNFAVMTDSSKSRLLKMDNIKCAAFRGIIITASYGAEDFSNINTMEIRNSYLINKAFNSFLLASLSTMAAIQIGDTVDGMMLSHFIGEEAMCSVNICRPVVKGIAALCTLLGAGGSMMVGMEIGNHNREKANHIFTDIVMAAAAIGLALFLVGIVWLRPLTSLLCPEASLQGITAEYLSVTLYGSAFCVLSGLMAMLVAVDGSPRHVTIAVLASAVSNVAFDFLLIVTMGWGVLGAALATLLSYVVLLLVLLPHFFRKDALRLVFSRCFATLPRSVAIGLPLGIGSMLTAVQMWGNNNIVMTSLGQCGIVALSVCLYMQCISDIIINGSMKAFQPVASILKGAGDNQGVLLAARKLYRFLVASMCLLAVPMVFFPKVIAAAFGVADPTDISTTAVALAPFAAYIFLVFIIYPFITIYQLYGNKGIAIFISISKSAVPMLCMLLMATVAVDGIWWGLPLGQMATAAFVALYAFARRRRDRMLAPLTLVPRNEMLDGFETSIQPDIHAVSTLLQETDAFLKARISDPAMACAVEVSTEELMKNIITYGYVKHGRRRYIDYRLSVMPDRVRVVISDDAKAFNPIGQRSKTGFGLQLINGLCKNISYDYLFRQNIVTMEFEYGKTA